MESAERLALARQLVAALEEGNVEGELACLQALQDVRTLPLLRHVAEITRDVHQSLLGLSDYPQLAEIAQVDMPDARQRLAYVMEKSEEAAHRTLSLVEDLTPVADALAAETHPGIADHGARLRAGLTEILMAQEYQDLTGQVIRRTIEIVDRLESKLVALIASELPGMQTRQAAASDGQGPVMRGESNAVNRQDDVDALLAELGI